MHRTKKILKSIFILLATLFALVLLYLFYLTIHLKVYLPDTPLAVKELSSNQKEKDFKVLTKYVADLYPFNDALVSTKQLKDLNILADEYISRARLTTSNEEFLRLFIEYTELLRQAGHGGIVFPTYDLYSSYTLDIPKDAYLKSNYWKDELAKLNLYYHSDIDITYVNGSYVVKTAYTIGDITLPANSVLTTVNNQPVEEYVKSLQNITPLRFDEENNKVYSNTIFIKDPGSNEKGWNAEFTLPDSSTVQILLPKIPGFQPEDISKLYPSGNLFLTTLDESIGYIKINSFEQQFISSDQSKLEEYFENNPHLDKIILDLRGNTGGEPTYWVELLLRPFLKETAEYTQTTAVTKKFFKTFGLRYPVYRFIYSNDLLDKKTNHIANINKIDLEGYSVKSWNVYEITKRFTPEHSYSFDGQLYLLTDNDTLSAADSYVTAVRELNLGTVVGTNTLGWGNIFISPMIFALPNSGLMFRMDVEAAFNVDGRETSIYGTNPDIKLSISEYPATYPQSYSKNALLEDEWIKWCMQQDKHE
ncbi:MAG: S41 family peptidase [Mobilitalea sp.]